jgi:4-hydroxy-tetrahydrodipicolinate synthase
LALNTSFIDEEGILMKKLKGTFAVMVTPFTDNEDLDEKGLRQNIVWYIKEGIHGVICNGSTSEFANLSK